jgi:hypothetical protein
MLKPKKDVAYWGLLLWKKAKKIATGERKKNAETENR